MRFLSLMMVIRNHNKLLNSIHQEDTSEDILRGLMGMDDILRHAKIFSPRYHRNY